MKQLILFVALILTFTSCNRIFICGLGSPRTKLDIINDSTFTYHYYAGTIGDYKYDYSKGIVKKIGRKKFLLQSSYFSPNRIPFNVEQTSIANQKGFAIKVKTDLYEEFFRFDKGKCRLFVDDKIYNFKRNLIDTLINIASVDSIKIEIELEKPDINVPSPNYRLLKTENIKVLKGINKIDVTMPVTGEEFDWINIDHKYLIKKRKSYELDKKSIQVEKITTYNISNPSSAAAVVFGGQLSAWAAFRLNRKTPAVRPCV